MPKNGDQRREAHGHHAEVERLRDFAELSSDWFWEQDAEFRFLNFSGVHVARISRSPDSVIGLKRWELPIRVPQAELDAHIAACKRHEPFQDFEYDIASADGSYQRFSVSGKPVFDDEGIFRGYRGIGRNITTLHRARQALRRHEQQLLQIIENSPVAVFVIDESHRVTHWNRACELLTGIRSAEVIGTRDAWRGFYETERPTLCNLMLNGADDQEIGRYYGTQHAPSSVIPQGHEAEMFFPQNAYRKSCWLFFTAAPILDPLGNKTGAIETLQDVTDRHRATEALESRVTERTEALSQQIHFMQELIETIPGPLFYKSRDGAYLGCNQAFADFLGKTREEIIGHTAHDLAPKHLADIYHAADEMLYASGGHQIYETRVRSASGRESDVMFHKAVYHNQEGEQGGLIGIMLDISERISMEVRLRQAANVFDSTADGVAITDSEGRIVAVNRAFTRITGYEENEVIGLNHRRLHLGDGAQLDRSIDTALAQDGFWRGELWSRRKDDSPFAEQLTITTVHDKAGVVSHYVEVFSDVTLLKRTQERLDYQAHHDALTGLPNRMLFEQLFEKSLQRSRRDHTRVALLFVDLDRFKSVNDTHGHDVGDRVLIEMASRLRSILRESDTVARLGGDEFIVLLEGLDSAEAATRIAEKIAACADEVIYADGCECRIGASVGISLYPDDGDSFADLMKSADAAMYRIKRRD